MEEGFARFDPQFAADSLLIVAGNNSTSYRWEKIFLFTGNQSDKKSNFPSTYPWYTKRLTGLGGIDGSLALID